MTEKRTASPAVRHRVKAPQQLKVANYEVWRHQQTPDLSVGRCLCSKIFHH